jgi:hypothetical protein
LIAVPQVIVGSDVGADTGVIGTLAITNDTEEETAEYPP